MYRRTSQLRLRRQETSARGPATFNFHYQLIWTFSRHGHIGYGQLAAVEYAPSEAAVGRCCKLGEILLDNTDCIDALSLQT